MKPKTQESESLFNIANNKTIICNFKNMLTKDEYEISSKLVKKYRLSLTSRATPEDFKLLITYLVTFRNYILENHPQGSDISRSIKELNLHISSIYARLTRKHPKKIEYWCEHFNFCFKNKLLRDLRKSINLGLKKCGDNYRMYVEKIRFEYNVKEDVQEGRKCCIKAIGLHKIKQDEILATTIESEVEYFTRNELKDDSFLVYARELLNQLMNEDIKEHLILTTELLI